MGSPTPPESLPLSTRSSTDEPRPALSSESPPTAGAGALGGGGGGSRPSPPSRESSSGEDDEQGEQSTLLACWEGDDDDDDELDLNNAGGNNVQTPRSWGEGTWEAGSGMATASSSSHSSRSQNRRVYGGGRHGDSLQGGGRTTEEVAGMILAGTLSPTPLLLPHAAALLGLPLFLPLLFLTGALSWFAYVAIGVEARYCGSRSWPSLASAVFPHRFKAHRVGELLASLLVFLGSIARGVLGVVAASEVVVDLFVPIGGRRWWERVIVVGIIALVWVLLPLVILPLIRTQLRRRPTSTHSAVSALLRLPAWLALLLWPLALLILGLRLKQLNIEHPHPGMRELTFPAPVAPSPAGEEASRGEAMGLSIWGGISLVIFSLSCHHDAFKFFGSLARPSSTATATSSLKRRSSVQISTTDENPSPSATLEGRRNQWPLAAALGVAGATLIQLGWGLVGYLGLPNGGREGNLLASPALPRGDGWLMLVRGLVLLAVVAPIEGNLGSAYVRMGKGIELSVGKAGGAAREARRRSYVRVAGEESARKEEAWDWRAGMARVLVWSVVVGMAVWVCGMGEEGEGLVNVAEVGGAVLSSLTGFLIPSLFFIALFHLRRPRSIFISDPSLPAFASDTLLLRKEREVQRRLSGRRIWQDVLVFGGLLPFGVVALVRGCVAIATKED